MFFLYLCGLSVNHNKLCSLIIVNKCMVIVAVSICFVQIFHLEMIHQDQYHASNCIILYSGLFIFLSFHVECHPQGTRQQLRTQCNAPYSGIGGVPCSKSGITAAPCLSWSLVSTMHACIFHENIKKRITSVASLYFFLFFDGTRLNTTDFWPSVISTAYQSQHVVYLNMQKEPLLFFHQAAGLVV